MNENITKKDNLSDKIRNLDEKIFYLAVGALALSVAIRSSLGDAVKSPRLLFWSWMSYAGCIFVHILALICYSIDNLPLFSKRKKLRSICGHPWVFYLSNFLLVVFFFAATVLLIRFGYINNT